MEFIKTFTSRLEDLEKEHLISPKLFKRKREHYLWPKKREQKQKPKRKDRQAVRENLD